MNKKSITHCSIILFILSFIIGCNSLNNTQQDNTKELNKRYGLSYQLTVENDNAGITFFDRDNNFISKLTLPDENAYVRRKELLEFCDEDNSLCPDMKSESSLVSWSPGGDFLAVFAGDTQGFWFVPTIEITKSAFNERHILKIGLHQTTNRFNIGLFHQTGGWLNNEQYVFSAGISGDNFVYKFNTKTKELKGFPFELNEDSTVSSFKEVFVESFNSQKSSFKLSDVIQQLDKLK